MELTQQARDTSSEQQGETMKILIEEAERLYRQIDKAQVHLINARLNNDEEGKKSAISEMETTMCNAMQLLTCLVEHKDNIVDLGEVWHDINIVPSNNKGIIYLTKKGKIGVIKAIKSDKWDWYVADKYSIIKWAYLSELLPEGGER